MQNGEIALVVGSSGVFVWMVVATAWARALRRLGEAPIDTRAARAHSLVLRTTLIMSAAFALECYIAIGLMLKGKDVPVYVVRGASVAGLLTFVAASLSIYAVLRWSTDRTLRRWREREEAP